MGKYKHRIHGKNFFCLGIKRLIDKANTRYTYRGMRNRVSFLKTLKPKKSTLYINNQFALHIEHCMFQLGKSNLPTLYRDIKEMFFFYFHIRVKHINKICGKCSNFMLKLDGTGNNH